MSLVLKIVSASLQIMTFFSKSVFKLIWFSIYIHFKDLYMILYLSIYWTRYLLVTSFGKITNIGLFLLTDIDPPPLKSVPYQKVIVNRAQCSESNGKNNKKNLRFLLFGLFTKKDMQTPPSPQKWPHHFLSYHRKLGWFFQKNDTKMTISRNIKIGKSKIGFSFYWADFQYSM